MASSPTPSNAGLIFAFNSLQISGCIILTAVLLTATLSPDIVRSAPWYNIIITQIFSTFSFSLIVGMQRGPEPPFALCLLQAMFVYAAPAMSAVACLCYSIELLFTVRSFIGRGQVSKLWRLFNALPPYAIGLVEGADVLWIDISKKASVARSPTGMYCHVNPPPNVEASQPAILTVYVIALSMFSVLPSVGMTIYFFIRHWNLYKDMRVAYNGSLPLRTLVRFGIICFLVISGAVIPVVAIVVKIDESPYAVALSSLPIIVALVFGTQHDILRVWMFWQRRADKPSIIIIPLDSGVALNAQQSVAFNTV